MGGEKHRAPEQDESKESKIVNIKRKLAMYYQYIADYYAGVRGSHKQSFTNTAEAIKSLEQELQELEK